jgi:hypothetical protein
MITLYAFSPHGHGNRPGWEKSLLKIAALSSSVW